LPNGIFDFNITRLLAYIDAHPDDLPLEPILVADIPDFGASRLDEPLCARPICHAQSRWRKSHPDVTT
jgi:hypothetical protein